MLQLAILVSGSGSNLQALIEGQEQSYRIKLVISNVPGVKALERARAAGIATQIIAHQAFRQRAEFDNAIGAALAEAGVDLVCLAGFMRILGPKLTGDWQGRMINIHPALLPSFKGLNTHKRALAAGVAVHGCSVHQVTADLDDGPILLQGIVPVLSGDDEARLAARVLKMEHRCYPQAVKMLARQKTRGAQPCGGRLLLDPLLVSS